MKKIFFGILLTIIILTSINMVSAAASVGSWVDNNNVVLTITQGQTTEFRYGVTAVTIYGGKYSVALYREGNNVPIITYVNNQPTITNGALGRFNVTPQNYQNTIGNYYILITSSDKFNADTFRLNLKVIPAPQPELDVQCIAMPLNGNAPLKVTITSQITGGSGKYAPYLWNFGEWLTTNTEQNMTNIYKMEGTYTITLTVKDANNLSNTKTANCGTVIVKQLPVEHANCTDTDNGKNYTVFGTTTGYNPIMNSIITLTDQCASNNKTLTEGYCDTLDHINTIEYNCEYGCNNGVCKEKEVIPILTCTDSDNGKNYYTYGFVETYANTINAKKYNDTCYGNTLIEYSCNTDKTLDTTTFTCEFGCNNGACNTNNVVTKTCTDSDNGQNYNTYGTTETYTNTISTGKYNDTCNGNTLTEYYCNNDKTLGTTTILCEFGCNNGACNTNNIITKTCTDSDNGKDYYIFGTTETYTNTISTGKYNDTCNGNTLIEYNCNTDKTLGTTTYNCEYGCTNGICNQVPEFKITCTAQPITGNSPLTTIFNGTITAGGTGTYTYEWSFGDGQISTQLNNLHTYNTVGIYATRLKITDSNNNVGTANCGTITVTNPIITPVLTCTDSDNGQNYNTYGTTETYTNTISTGKYNDTCNGNTLTEYSCNTDKTLGTTTYTCANGCYNGACKENATITPTCTDSDNGKDYYTLGTTEVYTINKNTEKYTDVCYGNIVAEYYCNTDNMWNMTTYTCENGCSNGACIKLAELSVTCNAMPNNGIAQVLTTFTSTVAGGSGIYSYNWNFNDGTTSNVQNTVSHTYNKVGTYNAVLTITDSKNNVKTVNCGTITVNANTTTILIANSGGPYKGYINDKLIFNASLSKEQIVMYKWDFGDGNIVYSTTPTIEHTYNKINRYIVTLTVYNAKGESNTVITDATITEKTSYGAIITNDLPDKGLIVNHLMLYGINGEILKTTDELTTDISVKNVGNTKLKNVRITVSIPDLGIEAISTLFDLSKGKEHDDMIVLPIYNVPKGTYYVKILIENDDGNSQVKRIKYREIIVR